MTRSLDDLDDPTLNQTVVRIDLLTEQLDRIEGKVNAITSYVEPKQKSIVTGVPLESTDVRQIFETWVRAMGKRPPTTKLTPERRRCIQARLKDGYTVEFIERAIKGCAASDFHMGRERTGHGVKRFNDLTLICRNGSMLEKFAEITPENQPSGSAWL